MPLLEGSPSPEQATVEAFTVIPSSLERTRWNDMRLQQHRPWIYTQLLDKHDLALETQPPCARV